MRKNNKQVHIWITESEYRALQLHRVPIGHTCRLALQKAIMDRGGFERTTVNLMESKLNVVKAWNRIQKIVFPALSKSEQFQIKNSLFPLNDLKTIMFDRIPLQHLSDFTIFLGGGSRAESVILSMFDEENEILDQNDPKVLRGVEKCA